MVFDARAAKAKAEASGDYAPWPFVGLDGEDYALPHPLSLPTGLSLEIQQAADAGEEVKVFELLGGVAPEAAEAIKAMEGYVVTALFEDWNEAAGEMGKARSASSGANRAERRSRRT